MFILTAVYEQYCVIIIFLFLFVKKNKKQLQNNMYCVNFFYTYEQITWNVSGKD